MQHICVTKTCLNGRHRLFLQDACSNHHWTVDGTPYVRYASYTVSRIYLAMSCLKSVALNMAAPKWYLVPLLHQHIKNIIENLQAPQS